ncbi:MAG: hypothetical protein U0R78_18445 [Nocardioidaceae bacterium]
MRWDIVNPAVGQLLYGKLAEPYEVAYSGFITGQALSRLQDGVVGYFGPEDVQNDPLLAQGVGQGATQVAMWTEDFTSVRGIIEYLTQRPGEKLLDPRGILPGTWPHRLFVAAAVAVTAGEPDGRHLAELAIEAIAPWRGRSTDEGIARLRAALG